MNNKVTPNIAMRRAAVVERAKASRPARSHNSPSWGEIGFGITALAAVAVGTLTIIKAADSEPEMLPQHTLERVDGTVDHMAPRLCPLTPKDVVIDWVKTHNNMTSSDFGNLQDGQLIIWPDCPQPVLATPQD